MISELHHDREPVNRIVPHIVNEYSPLQKVLVVPTPEVVTTFTEIKDIDPKAKHINPIHEKLVEAHPGESIIVQEGAAERHGALLDVLRNNGVGLVYSDVPPGHNGHTPLFTRDVGIILDDKVLPSRLRFSYRTPEVQGLLDSIDPSRIIQTDRDYMAEGGDIAVLDNGLVLVGIGPRTNHAAVEILREAFPDKEFIEVFPVDEEKAFHLDTVMGVVGEKTLIYQPTLVPADLVDDLESRGYVFIEADFGDYLNCSTNVLAIADKRIIAPAENTITNENLRRGGVDVIEVPLAGILELGGGPHCLTLPLVRA